MTDDYKQIYEDLISFYDREIKVKIPISDKVSKLDNFLFENNLDISIIDNILKYHRENLDNLIRRRDNLYFLITLIITIPALIIGLGVPYFVYIIGLILLGASYLYFQPFAPSKMRVFELQMLLLLVKEKREKSLRS